MNENLVPISDMSLSDRDIVQDKDDSIQNKTFYSTDLDVTDLVSKKDYFQIKIIKDDNILELSTKSIKKIFGIISGENHENLVENYLDYITWLIDTNNEFERQQLLTPNGKVDNPQTNLEHSYYQLLTKTKIYYINIPKVNVNDEINNRIKIKSYSLGKISSFLGLDIFDIKYFIEIFILSFKEKEDFANINNIKSKLIDKFNDNKPKEAIEFNITKKFELILKESEKCKKNKLENFEEYFEKVLNEIEKKNLNEDKNYINSSELSSENEDKDNNENNIDIPKSYNINQNINKHIGKDKDIETRRESACGGNICANICNIF